MQEINIYRVRKSFEDLKSQKGAFFTLEAAVKVARKFGLNVYSNEKILIFKGSECNE